MSNNEMRHYIGHVLKTNKFRLAIFSVFNSKLNNILNKQLYPSYLKSTSFNAANEIINTEINHKIKLKLKLISTNPKKLTTLSIPLATRNIPISQNPNWSVSFQDSEDFFALHRFGWIHRILVESPEEQNAFFSLDLMLNWIDNNPCNKKNPAWESYSVSERIVNWLFFLLIMQNNEKIIYNKDIILNSLLEHADYLLNNLEYHGKNETNNHFINNGRALYIAGAVLGINQYRDIGKTILIEEHEEMFTSSGFLRESSSHYHLLLCRTYIEILWIAEMVEDIEFVEQISKFILPMLECIRFLVPSKNSNLPLIGDVSPDYPPSWLNGLPTLAEQMLNQVHTINVAHMKGWHSLWLPRKNSLLENKKHHINKISTFEEKDNGWIRFFSENYSLLWNTNSDWSKTSTFHGHGDAGSFELHWKDFPIFIDSGRMTYMNNQWGKYGKSAASHNSIIIDGYEPFVINRVNGFRSMIQEYTKCDTQTNIKNNTENKVFTIEHEGYKRIFPDLTIKRSFVLYSKEVIINDTIYGSGKHNVKTYFHLHPDVEIKQKSKNKFQLKVPSLETLYLEFNMDEFNSIKMLNGVISGTLGGWYFPEYGKRVPSYTLIFEQTIEFPHSNRFSISSE